MVQPSQNLDGEGATTRVGLVGLDVANLEETEEMDRRNEYGLLVSMVGVDGQKVTG
jgi:hypothetical protein